MTGQSGHGMTDCRVMVRTDKLRWTIYPVSRFGDFCAPWDALCRDAGAAPFMQSMFIRHAIAQFGQGNERIAICGPESAPYAMAIVASRRPGVWETFQPSQLPLGAWLMLPGTDYEVCGRQLLRALPGWAQLLAITQQDPAMRERPDHTATLLTLDYMKTGWIALDGNFATYWKERGKGLRQNMRTQRSRLLRDGIGTRLEIVRSAADVESTVRAFSEMESSGWKGREGTAVRTDTPQARFYLDVLRDYCAAGLARLCVYKLNERPAAIDLHIECSETIVLLKTAYDESVRGISPSSMLREEFLCSLFDEGRIRRLEFFGPAMDWTYKWTDKIRTLFHVNVYRSGIVRWLHQTARGQLPRTPATRP